MKRIFSILFFVMTVCLPMFVSAKTTVAIVEGSVNNSSNFANTLAWWTENSCWFCGVFGTIFDILNEVISTVCYTMKPVLLTLLGVLFLFWLLFRVGKVVLDISGSADGAMIPDILKQLMKVIVASLLIVFYLDVFDFLLSPVLEMGIGFGNKISSSQIDVKVIQASRLEMGASGEGPVSTVEQSLCKEYQEAAEEEAKATTGSRGQGSEKEKAYSAVTKEAFLCYLRLTSASLASGMAMGSTILGSWFDMWWIDKFRHLSLPIVGLEVFLSFFMLFLAVPLKLFEPLMNLAFISALLPLWVALWAFKGTSKYSQKAIDTFVSVIVHLIVISIMTVICIEMLNGALGSEADRKEIIGQLLRGRQPVDIFGKFGVVSPAMLMTVALGYLAYAMIQKTSDIAKHFEGGINFGVGDAAAKAVGAANQLIVNSGANLTSAAYHYVRHAANQGGIKGALARGGMIGSAALLGGVFGPGGLALGALGGTAAAIRKAPKPANRTYRGNSLLEMARASRMNMDGTFKMPKIGTDQYRLDGRSHVHSRTNMTNGNVDVYDADRNTYTEKDKYGRVQNSYDRANGIVGLNGTNFKFSTNAAGDLVIDVNGVSYTRRPSGDIVDSTGALVRPARAREIRDALAFQAHAVTQMTEFNRQIAASGVRIV